MSNVKYAPMEDVCLAILRRALPDVQVLSLVPDDDAPGVIDPGEPADFFILVRRAFQFGEWEGDGRGFVDSGGVEVHVYTHDPDGDLKGALISEAVRSIFERAAREKWRVDDTTSIHAIRMVIEPIRKPDWVSATGPVQYADLPESAWRYITTYQFKTRRQTRKP